MENLGLLALFAPLAIFWQQIRNVVKVVFSFFVRTDSMMNGSMYPRLVNYLLERGTDIPIGDLFYNVEHIYGISEGKLKYTIFRLKNRHVILHRKWFPILVSRTGVKISITYLNLLNFEKTLKDFIDVYNDYVYAKQASEKGSMRLGSGFYYREVTGMGKKRMLMLQHQKDGSGMPGQGASAQPTAFASGGGEFPEMHFSFLRVNPPVGEEIDNIQFAGPYKRESKYYYSEQCLEVRKQVEQWFYSLGWYQERGISWRRGCCLAGEPGSGKSALVKEIAKHTQSGLFVFNLNTMDNEEFETELKNVDDASGAIILFEDIDTVWDGRKSASEDGINFDLFINKLSGVNAVSNAFIFMTTNHVDRLDPALIRDGRIDFVTELPPLTREGKRFIASRMLDQWPELIETVVTDERETAARFENRVTKIAIDRYWRDTHK